MREIKFRAWDGSKLIYLDDINWIDFRSGFANVLDEYNYENSCSKDINLNKNNIMQFTGAKDSDGKEIYEGDILKVEDYWGKDVVGRVIYDEVGACYWIMEGDERSHFKMTFDLESYVHNVIGNIYENPELLG